MQFINDRARRLAEARTIGALMAIVEHAGWKIDRNAPDILSPKFREFLYVPKAELLLVPVLSRPAYDAVGALVREARSDALCIALGRSTSGGAQVYASICEWSVGGRHWWEPHVPWIDDANRLWFVPDPDAHAGLQPSFQVGTGRLIRIDDGPLGEYEPGLHRAHKLFSQLEGF